MINLAGSAQRFVARNPHAPALIDPLAGVTRTFGELSRRVDLLSGALFDVVRGPPRHAGGGAFAQFTRDGRALPRVCPDRCHVVPAQLAIFALAGRGCAARRETRCCVLRGRVLRRRRHDAGSDRREVDRVGNQQGHRIRGSAAAGRGTDRHRPTGPTSGALRSSTSPISQSPQAGRRVSRRAQSTRNTAMAHAFWTTRRPRG